MATPTKSRAHQLPAPYRQLLAALCLIILGWFARDAWDWANTVDEPARPGISYDRDTVLNLGSEGLYMRIGKTDTYSMMEADWLEIAAMRSLIYERMGKSDVRKIYYYIRLDDCLRDVEGAKLNLMRGVHGGTAWSFEYNSPDRFLLSFVNRMRFPDPFGDEAQPGFPKDFGALQRAALERLCAAVAKEAEALEPLNRKYMMEYIEKMRSSFGYLINTINDLPPEQAQEVLDNVLPMDGKGELIMPSLGE